MRKPDYVIEGPGVILAYDRWVEDNGGARPPFAACRWNEIKDGRIVNGLTGELGEDYAKTPLFAEEVNDRAWIFRGIRSPTRITGKELKTRMRTEAEERRREYEHAKRVVEDLRDEFED